jgi:ABC-type bacteriocin/lantibiotic exporter with double-glycine peptidase domain
MVTQVERVVSALTLQGRDVSPREIEHQLEGLQGLPPEVAADALLRTYGLAPDGTALPGFEPDRTSRGVIVNLLRESRPTMIFVGIAALIGLIPAIAVPLIMRLFVDRYIVAQDTAWGLTTVIGLLVAAVIAATAVVVQYAALTRLRLRLARKINTAYVWSALTMRIPHLQRYGMGGVIGRLSAANRFSIAAGAPLPLALINCAMAIVFLVLIFALNFYMGLAALIITSAVLLVARAALRHRLALQRNYDIELVQLSRYTSDVVSSMESIKAAAWEQFAFVRWEAFRQKMAVSQTRLNIADQYQILVPTIGQTLGIGAFLGIGVIQVFAGTLSLGTLVAAQAFMYALNYQARSFTTIGMLAQSLSSEEGQFGAVVREPLDPEMLNVTTSDHLPENRFIGRVSLHEVTFGFDVDADPLLRDLSLDIEAGSRIALVGPSGSGKSTIAKLMLGELRPWSGYISLDGVPRLAVPRLTRTQNMAYVPQTATLFPGTIRDNLTLWDDSISDEAVSRAARDACIEDTILGRRGEYFHEIASTNGDFSGGELQRLAIARALAGDPQIIVLDEATSALDPVVEADVEARLRKRGVTTIVVAHRLSTIRDADEIFVIDGGRIVQRGSFSDLSREGMFAELVHG